jgi:hypothetical protein
MSAFPFPAALTSIIDRTVHLNSVPMQGETDLSKLLKEIQPVLNPGEFVFCTFPNTLDIPTDDVVMTFKEAEGLTVILRKERADRLGFDYGFVASWITLTVHSSMSAVGLTAAFSSALAAEGMSCNVVAGFYHDHIFIAREDSLKAIEILSRLPKS